MRSATRFLPFLLCAWILSACNMPESAASLPTASIAPVAVLKTAAECWNGPGQAYNVTAALNPGQAAEVIGRTPDGAYLLIRHPDSSAVFCWLQTASTTLVGDLATLPTYVAPATSAMVSGCPSPVGGGPTPVACPQFGGPPSIAGCPSPIGGGPTPVVCYAPVGGGCPSPVGGGPTPVACPPSGGPPPIVGCPSPIGGGPTPVACAGPGGAAAVVGCPSPIGGGPTPVSCSGPGGAAAVVGCPSPIGGGPTPIVCSGSGGPAAVYGCPSPIGGGPTPIDCSGSAELPPARAPAPDVAPRFVRPTPIEAPAPGLLEPLVSPLLAPTTVP